MFKYFSCKEVPINATQYLKFDANFILTFFHSRVHTRVAFFCGLFRKRTSYLSPRKNSCVAKYSISHLSSLEIIQYRYWMTKHYHFSVNEAEKDANIRKYVRDSRRMVYFHRNRHSFAYNYRHIFINATLLVCQIIKNKMILATTAFGKYI